MAVSQLALPAPSFRFSGLFICLIGLLLIAYSIALRIEPAVLGHPVLQSLHLTNENLTEIMLKYQFPMVFTFILAGLLIDIFGPRFWLVVALILTIAGNDFYSEATSLQEILIGRILIGFAHPFIFIGALKLGVDWLPKNHLGFYIGLLFAVLLLSPELFQPSFIAVSQHLGWDNTLNSLMALGGVLMLCLIVTCRLKSFAPGFASMNLVSVLRGGKIWILCIVSCLGWMSNTFLLNWGAIFLNKGLHFLPSLALGTVQNAFLFFALGAVFFGTLTDISRKPRLWLVLGYFFAALTFAATVAAPELSKLTVGNLFLATSFLTSTAIICYVLASDLFGAANSGFAFGLIAFVTTIGNTWFALFNTYLLAPIMRSQTTTALSSYMYLLALVPFALVLGSLLAIKLRKPKTLFAD
ncbi:MAG: MFS transporter [Gammaproteobacteria bacterium]|nr:MFS transporter [Gammaproteobacteria bacterium]